MANTTDIVNRLCCKQNSRFCWCAKCSAEPGHQPYIQKQYSSQSANCTRRAHLLFTECNKIPRPCFIQTLSYCLQTFFRDFLSGCDGCVMSRLFYCRVCRHFRGFGTRRVTALDLCPRHPSVLQCDFLQLQVLPRTKRPLREGATAQSIMKSKPLSCNVLNYICTLNEHNVLWNFKSVFACFCNFARAVWCVAAILCLQEKANSQVCQAWQVCQSTPVDVFASGGKTAETLFKRFCFFVVFFTFQFFSCAKISGVRVWGGRV